MDKMEKDGCCIYCHTEFCSEHFHAAGSFLSYFDLARSNMKIAADKLLFASEGMSEERKRRYRRIHKRMVGLRRLWCELERERELKPAKANE